MKTETTLRLERTYNAAPDRVFDAWTDPTQLAKWFAPGGMAVKVYEVDARPGGKYRIGMVGPEEYIAIGTYKVVDRPKRLVFSWNWEGQDLDSIVTIEIDPDEAGSRLVLTHEGLPDAATRDNHRDGWQGSLGNLETLFG